MEASQHTHALTAHHPCPSTQPTQTHSVGALRQIIVWALCDSSQCELAAHALTAHPRLCPSTHPSPLKGRDGHGAVERPKLANGAQQVLPCTILQIVYAANHAYPSFVIIYHHPLSKSSVPHRGKPSMPHMQPSIINTAYHR